MSTAREFPESRVLSYRPQEPSADMVWVLRWVGIWIMVSSAPDLLASAKSIIEAMGVGSGVPTRAYQIPRGLLRIAFMLVGLGVWRRMRPAFYAALILLALPLLLREWSLLTSHVSYNRWDGLFIGMREAPALLIEFLIVWSLWRRAEARGALRPPVLNALRTIPAGDDLIFLLQRVGWFFSVLVFVVAADVVTYALVPLSGVPPVPWNWTWTISLAAIFLKGLLGLALIFKVRGVLVALAILLLVEAVWGQIVIMTAGLTRPPTFASLQLAQVVSALALAVLLIWLYRHLSRRAGSR